MARPGMARPGLAEPGLAEPGLGLAGLGLGLAGAGRARAGRAGRADSRAGHHSPMSPGHPLGGRETTDRPGSRTGVGEPGRTIGADGAFRVDAPAPRNVLKRPPFVTSDPGMSSEEMTRAPADHSATDAAPVG